MKKKYFLLLFIYFVITLSAQNIIYTASEPDYPPFCIVDKNGEADGFSVDLFKASALIMGLEVEFKVDHWSTIKEELADGKIDALPLVGRSLEREKIFDFTFPYHTLHGAIFIREGTTGINYISDLKNKKIIVMKGDNAEEYILRENISKYITTTDSFELAFKLLKTGKYDAVIAQRLMGLQLLDLLDINTIIPLNIELPGFSQDFSFAVTEGNKVLLEKLNEGLALTIADGTFEELYKKWFSPDLQYQVSFIEVLKIAMYIVIPLLILIALAAIVILRSEVKRKTKFLHQEIVVREKAEKEIKNQLLEKEIILKETHHRIKNNFASIISLLSLQAQTTSNTKAKASLQDAIGRVNSMHILYEKLLLTDDYMITSVKEYLSVLTDDIIELFPGEMKVTVEKQITDFNLEPRRLVPLGIILNELLTNIMKYAFTNKKDGLIVISLKNNHGHITLSIQDNGVGLPEDFDISKSTGFGLKLVDLLSQQLKGTYTIENNNGVKNSFEFWI